MILQMNAVGIYAEIATPGQQTLQFTNFADGYRDAIYELSRLARIANTIPIAAAEHLFITFKQVKTYLHTMMSDECQSNLVTPLIHSRRSKNLDMEKDAGMFIKMFLNCHILLQ